MDYDVNFAVASGIDDDGHWCDDDCGRSHELCHHCRDWVNRDVNWRDVHHDRDDICRCRSEP